jgi:hypothetical protein
VKHDIRRPAEERPDRTGPGSVADEPALESQVGPEPDPHTQPLTESDSRSVTQRVASALGGAAEYVEHAASAVGEAVEKAARRLEERPGARVRRVRRLGATPLPYLYAIHADARQRTQRELGIRTIEVDDIAGTAVGGAPRRGGDFLPLKPFRSTNWMGRWQRLGHASDSLAILPPIDVMRYDGGYWVLDGHNRVGMAKYGGQASIDADVTDLVDPASPRPDPRTDPAESFASLVEDSRQLRAAVHRSAPRRAPNVPPGLSEPARAEPQSAIQREQEDAEEPR